jgi:hypothetical protein
MDFQYTPISLIPNAQYPDDPRPKLDLSPREILEQAYDYLSPVFYGSSYPIAGEASKITAWVRGHWMALTQARYQEVAEGDVRELAMDIGGELTPVSKVYGGISVNITQVCSVGAMLLALGLSEPQEDFALAASEEEWESGWSDRATELAKADPNFTQALGFLVEAIHHRYPTHRSNRYGAITLEAIKTDATVMIDYVLSWNDFKDRKQEQVLEVFRDAIKKAADA